MFLFLIYLQKCEISGCFALSAIKYTVPLLSYTFTLAQYCFCLLSLITSYHFYLFFGTFYNVIYSTLTNSVNLKSKHAMSSFKRSKQSHFFLTNVLFSGMSNHQCSKQFGLIIAQIYLGCICKHVDEIWKWKIGLEF